MSLNFQILDAVDARDSRLFDRNQFYDANTCIHLTGLPMVNGEIGCALSHISACRELLASQADAALILEDDAIVGVELREFLHSLRRSHLERIDILNLYSSQEEIRVLRRHSITIGSVVAHRVISDTCYNTVAYVITRTGAARMISYFERRRKIVRRADWPIYPPNWRFFIAAPFLVGHSEMPSEIGERFPGNPKSSTAQRAKDFVGRVLGARYFRHRYAYPSFGQYLLEEIYEHWRTRLAVRLARLESIAQTLRARSR